MDILNYVYEFLIQLFKDEFFTISIGNQINNEYNKPKIHKIRKKIIYASIHK